MIWEKVKMSELSICSNTMHHFDSSATQWWRNSVTVFDEAELNVCIVQSDH